MCKAGLSHSISALAEANVEISEKGKLTIFC